VLEVVDEVSDRYHLATCFGRGRKDFLIEYTTNAKCKGRLTARPIHIPGSP